MGDMPGAGPRGCGAGAACEGAELRGPEPGGEPKLGAELAG